MDPFLLEAAVPSVNIINLEFDPDRLIFSVPDFPRLLGIETNLQLVRRQNCKISWGKVVLEFEAQSLRVKLLGLGHVPDLEEDLM